MTTDHPDLSRRALLSVGLASAAALTFAPNATAADGIADLTYRSHVAYRGWLPWVVDGATSGSVGGRRVEALAFSTMPWRARGHVQGIGWQGWKSTGYIGTVGQSRRLEAFQLTLTGDIADLYTVQYRACVRGAWQPWVSNGATAGTTGRGLPMEAVEVRLVLKP